MTSQSSRRDGAEDVTTDEMEIEDIPGIGLQNVPMAHIETGVYTIPERSNIKQESDFYRYVDVAKFSEYSKYSDNVANIIDIKTEVIGSEDYHSGNMDNTHGPTHIDHSIGDQIPGTNVTPIKPEPEDETHTTSEFVIEIDTCKDEYYENYGYPTNGVELKSHKCPVCGVGFGRKYDMTRHTKIHTGEKHHTCSVCEVSFSQKSTLTKHMRMHTGEKPPISKVCGVAFAHENSFKCHTLTHIPVREKRHACSVCGVRFTWTANLKTHMVIHPEVKTHVCTVCEVSFTQKSDLTRHIQTHTGEKSFKCQICEVGFARKSNLTTHMRIHTGEKPYTCTVCGVAFRYYNGLKHHKSSQCHT